MDWAISNAVSEAVFCISVGILAGTIEISKI